MNEVAKPNCYECEHRGEVPGSAHSCCGHAKAGVDKNNAVGSMFAILGSVGRVGPTVGGSAGELGIKASEFGIRRGWFNWPWDFDPVWLLACNGFTAKTRRL